MGGHMGTVRQKVQVQMAGRRPRGDCVEGSTKVHKGHPHIALTILSHTKWLSVVWVAVAVVSLVDRLGL